MTIFVKTVLYYEKNTDNPDDPLLLHVCGRGTKDESCPRNVAKGDTVLTEESRFSGETILAAGGIDPNVGIKSGKTE